MPTQLSIDPALTQKRLYVRLREGDLDGNGTLLAGDNVNLHLTGDPSTGSGGTLTNRNATIAGRTVVSLTADNISNLNGRITGTNTTVAARTDLNDIGGIISGQNALTATAGRNLTVETTTATADNVTGNAAVGTRFSRTTVDRVAGLYVTNPNGILVASAGNDLSLIAAELKNSGANGQTTLAAGHDLNLQTVATAQINSQVWDARNHSQRNSSSEVGTTIQSSGDVALIADHDLTAKAASVTSDNGAITVVAGNDLTIATGTATRNEDTSRYGKKGGFLTSSSKSSHDTLDEKTAIASTFSGDTVDLQAGHDLTVSGSNVVSTHGTTLAAKNDIAIEAATQSSDETHAYQKSKSGVFASGNSLTLGSQKLKATNDTQTVSNLGSTVGSTDGSVSIIAGRDYAQTGSNVLAPKGDIDITAQKVDITSATDTSANQQTMKFKQSGLSVSISNPVINAVQTASQMKSAAAQTSDPRMQALAAATTALAANNAYDAVQPGSSNPAAQVGGINVSVSLGSSKSSSQSSQNSTTAVGSTVAAGNNVNITATGASPSPLAGRGGLGPEGRGEGDINVVGSEISAGRNATLVADNEVNLLAAQNTSSQQSSNKSSSASIGVSVGIGTNTGVGVTAAASKAKGNTNGTDVTYTNTEVTTGNTLALESGGDTNMSGATAAGKQVIADVGANGEGNLNIESLQESSAYRKKQSSAGLSVTVPVTGGGFAASANVGKTNIDSNYQSVQTQSGIKAGDNGFQVNVAGNTDLKGAVIASNDTASMNNRNRLTTGTLTTSDLQNKAEYNADSMSLGIGYSTNGNGVGTNQKGETTTGGTATPGSTLGNLNGFSAAPPVALSASGEASSTTTSGISNANIDITDNSKQQALTGKDANTTVALLNRDVSSDKDTSNALKPIFDQQTKADINAGFEITGAFVQQVGTFLNNRTQEADAKTQAAKANEDKAKNDPSLSDEQRLALLAQADTLRTEAQTIQSNWGAGGTNRQILTALTAAAGGNVTGTTGQFMQDMVVNYVQQQGANHIGQMVANGTLKEGSPEHAALHAILACAGAAASGQDCGSGAAGAAASSLLTGLFSNTTPDETNAEREAKRNLITTLVTGLASVTGQNAATTNNAASAAVDNNWLATQQIVQAKKELAACTTVLCKVETAGRWANTSVRQDVLTSAGLADGLVSSGWSDVKGVASFIRHPIDGINGIKQVLSDPALRQQLGDQIMGELDAKIARIETALNQGGDANAAQLGEDVGSLLWQVGSAATMVGGAAKGVATLAKVGVNVGAKGVETLTGLAKYDALLANGGLIAADGKPLMDFSKLTAAQKGVVGEILGPKTVGNILPDAQKLGRATEIGQTGIDDLYKVNKPGVDYVIVEYKFGTSELKMTKDGPQMSDDWLVGTNTRYNRLAESVGSDPIQTKALKEAFETGRIEKWVVHTDPAGGTSVWLVDSVGKIAKADAAVTSRVLGGAK